MSHACRMLALAALLQSSCAGEAPPLPPGFFTDAGSLGSTRATTDELPSPVDMPADAAAVPPQAQPDAGIDSEPVAPPPPASPPPPAAPPPPPASPDPCGAWSTWTCSDDPVFLCKASCGTNQLTCINSGECICGIGWGPCGKLAVSADGCETCRLAVASGCCQ